MKVELGYQKFSVDLCDELPWRDDGPESSEERSHGRQVRKYDSKYVFLPIIKTER